MLEGAGHTGDLGRPGADGLRDRQSDARRAAATFALQIDGMCSTKITFFLPRLERLWCLPVRHEAWDY